jgi:hypothetical protein
MEQQNDVQEIDEIVFGVYSAEEIKSMSVCKVDNPKLCNSDKTGSYGTVYDPRLGTIENGKLCGTCSDNVWGCPGHWGYIELHEPVIHPLYYKQVVSFLRCFCTKCYKLLITEDQVTVNGLNRIKGVKRFAKILERLEKIDMCSHCSHPQPAIKHTISDNTIAMVYKDKDKKKVSVTLQVDEIKKIFDNISIKDVELLGFNPDLMQPRNLILTVFPVIPISARPYVISDSNMCDDDLTIQLVEIIKSNNHLEPVDGVPVSDTKKQKYLQSLKFRIATFYNNSCLAPDTPVLLWDGSIKKAKEIKTGDELIGDDGEKRTVEITCEGEDEMYEISQDKGDTYIANSNHILTLKFSSHKEIFWVKANKNSPMGLWWVKWYDNDLKQIKNKTVSVTKKLSKDKAFEKIKKFVDSINISDTFDIKIKDYLKLSKSTTRYFMGFKLGKHINWDSKPILLDPYILGMWLGDGNSNAKGFTSADTELVDSWKRWAENNNAEIVIHGTKLSEKDKITNYTYNDSTQINNKYEYRPDIYFGIKSKFNQGYSRTHPSPLKHILNQYGIVKNKYIPDDYLYNNKEIRLKVLAGIIDTDGYVYNDGTTIEISQSIIRSKLIYQIQFLAKSLGFNSVITEKDATYKYNGEIKISKQLIVRISGYGIEEIPVLLKHKKCNHPKERNTLSTNIKVKSVGVGKYNGFIIDKNHRFLLGDFTVTHNSGKAKHSTNGRSIKGIKERLTGKEGLIRTNLMGKFLLKYQ